MYVVRSSLVGFMGTNCYTIINMDTKESILVDASGHISNLLRESLEAGAVLKSVLLTHAHYDHIDGIPSLRNECPDIEIYIGENDAPLLDSPELNLSQRFRRPISLKADHTVQDQQILNLIGLSIECIEVPGHTIGGMCYFIPELKCVFTGDTLVRGSIGRTTFPTGDKDLLINAIKRKLLTLPPDTVVYPGHDDASTIEQEIRHNRYLKGV